MGTPVTSVNSQVLLAALDERANQEKATIQEGVEQDIRLIHEQTEKALRALQAEAEQQSTQTLRRLQDQHLGQAKAKARLDLLQAKRQFLDQAFDRAKDKILALQVSPEYQTALAPLIRGAMTQMGPDAKLAVCPADTALCQAVVDREGLACSVLPSPTDQGTLRFTSANGQCRVDTSLLTRLERARSRCQAEVADILFGSQREEAHAES
jgi:vacuolar-type H+-ATPase subunit E/Vma4